MKHYKLFQNNLSILSMILFIGSVLGLISCNPAVSTSSVPLTQTNIQLSWVHTIEFAGFYEAVDRGYYTEENIEVRIDNGGVDDKGEFIDPIQRVVEGKNDFGIIGADSVMAARANGQPLVAVAAIYQRNPIVLMSLAKNNIVSPKDLVGKKIGVAPGDELIYQALFASQNISRDEVTEVSIDASLEPLLNGEVDVRTGFVTNEPIALRHEGHEVNLILPSDYGVNLYSNVIFTTEKTIAERPELIEKFLRATVRGYEDAIADPEHAAKLSVARNNELKVENETESMQASLPLLKPARSQVGMMEPAIWESMHQILLDNGILSTPLDFKAAYTLTFLEKVHAEQASNK